MKIKPEQIIWIIALFSLVLPIISAEEGVNVALSANGGVASCLSVAHGYVDCTGTIIDNNPATSYDNGVTQIGDYGQVNFTTNQTITNLTFIGGSFKATTDGYNVTFYNYSSGKWELAFTWLAYNEGAGETHKFNATEVGGTDFSRFTADRVRLTSLESIGGVGAMYLAELWAFNASIELGTPVFTITATDKYNGSIINNFTVTISNSTYTTTNTTTVGSLVYDNIVHGLYDINISANETGYFPRTFKDYNVSTDLSAELWQSILNLTVLDVLTDSNILSFNVTTTEKTYTGSDGKAGIYLNAGKHTINITASGYEDYTFDFTASILTQESQTEYLSPYLNFTILRETDNEAFNTSDTTQTKLTVYCPSDTLEFNFNVTSGSNKLTEPISCQWDLVRMDFIYNTSSYYRILIPDYSEREITFYALDLIEDLAYQIILVLNDLTGEYSDASAILMKDVGGSAVTIIEQTFDAENKVVAYLLKDGLYTLKIRNSAGQERSLGYFIADAAEEKTITVPEIYFVPDSYFGGSIAWEWDYDPDYEIIRLYYNDSTIGGTSWINMTVWNGSNVHDIIYSTQSLNISSAVITYSKFGGGIPWYPLGYSASYLVCFNASHPTIGYFHECRVFGRDAPFGGSDGFTDEEIFNFKGWFCGLFLVALIMLFRNHITAGLGLFSFFMWLFLRWDWLTFGSTWLDYTILSLSVLITILTYFVEGSKK